MQHPFSSLEGEYEALIARAQIRPECEHVLSVTAIRLLHDKAVYGEVAARTGVPIAVLMALSEREMSGNLRCYLGNGQLLIRRTTIVPIGRGPFLRQAPQDFIVGCLDALHLDGLDQVASQPGGWTMPRAAYETEEWNGEGYRRMGIPSPYVFGATSVQRPGKYIRDHVYDSHVMDPQLGTLAIIEKLMELDSSLSFGAASTKIIDDAPPIVPAPHPVTGATDIRWVQASLNKLHADGTPLDVDGDCGRGTRAAVRAFEIKRRLTVDRGWPGPQVVGALSSALTETGLS